MITLKSNEILMKFMAKSTKIQILNQQLHNIVELVITVIIHLFSQLFPTSTIVYNYVHQTCVETEFYDILLIYIKLYFLDFSFQGFKEECMYEIENSW